MVHIECALANFTGRPGWHRGRRGREREKINPKNTTTKNDFPEKMQISGN
jgi:hypothetical protein